MYIAIIAPTNLICIIVIYIYQKMFFWSYMSGILNLNITLINLIAPIVAIVNDPERYIIEYYFYI